MCRASKLVDAAGLLTEDPRQSAWRQVLLKALPDNSSGGGGTQIRLEPDLSPVSEVLNVAYAQHELVSSTTTHMLDWFEANAA